ncbi:MAG: signal peptidase I [Clostridia bacterium]|nr:signal peptidase I [Clostridia bacterium]
MAEEKKTNKVIDTIGDIVTVVILVFAVIFTVLTLSSVNSESGLPNVAGYSLFSVQSDSMEPVFYTGDLLVIKQYKGEDLNPGDIISFRTIEQGQYIINTHRIVEEHQVSDITTYTTRGDNTPANDQTDVVESEIVGVYSYKSQQENGVDNGKRVKGLGKVIDFVKGTGETGEKWSWTIGEGTDDERKLNLSFLFFIILPLALIFLFQIYKFIAALNESKKEKLMEEVSNNAELSEELKQKAIAEYLAKQAAEAKEAEVKEAEKVDNTAETGKEEAENATEATPEETPAEEENKEEN